jgi:hypothetical protein
MSNIPEWISDQLCRTVTGSGFSKRELYTDDDDIIYNFKRCIGLNGINLAATKADLLDRGIIIELERITKDKIRKVEEIWQEFEKIKPQLLGYIFDILVKVLQVKRSGGIELNGLPRMADFAELGEIISRCMGHEDNKFLGAYYNNIGLQIEAAIESSPVGTTIIKLMEDKQEWEGTATNLLNDLEPIANELKINTSYKLWPKSANSLSRRVTEVKTNLREIGITIKYDKDTKTRVKIIKIRKVSFESFEDKNHAQIASDNPNDIDGNPNDISFEDNKISFDKIPQNRAQISSPNDMNDPNDIIRPSHEGQQYHEFECYYCNDFQTTSNVEDYEKHVISKHGLGHPCYPCKLDLERLGIKAQGKSWEI